jgi:hypothetical protein
MQMHASSILQGVNFCTWFLISRILLNLFLWAEIIEDITQISHEVLLYVRYYLNGSGNL